MIRARLSLDALSDNARAAGVSDAVVDLRRDAWGHGIRDVLPVLMAAGVGAVVVDPRDRAIADHHGAPVTEADATVDGAELFGLPANPVLRASSRVLSVKALRRGEGVSYGYTHRAAADTRVALVGGGYGHGVVRALGNRVSVEIDGALHPVVGRVAMDVCVVDIGDTVVTTGDDVVYFGGSGPAQDALLAWESATGLSAAELVCAVGLRARREDDS